LLFYLARQAACEWVTYKVESISDIIFPQGIYFWVNALDLFDEKKNPL